MSKARLGRPSRRRDGVKLLELADGRHVARWVDPVTGKATQTSLDRLGLTTQTARAAWCAKKAEALAALRAAVAIGGTGTERAELADVAEGYLAAVAHDRTRRSKALPLRAMARWLADAGVTLAADVTGPLVMRHWRDRVTDPASPRQPSTQCRWLSVGATFLRWLRRRGYCPALTAEAIDVAAEPVRVPRHAPDVLTVAEVRDLLTAAMRYAADDRRRRDVAPLMLALLLTGARWRELGELTWGEVLPDSIRLAAHRTKIRRARSLEFDVAPTLATLFEALREAAGDPAPTDRVWPGAAAYWPASVRVLVARYGVRPFTANTLRRTAGTVLTCAAGIFGGSSAYLSARRLGHSVTIAERVYVGLLRGLPPTAKTIEAALGVEDLAAAIIAKVRT